MIGTVESLILGRAWVGEGWVVYEEVADLLVTLDDALQFEDDRLQTLGLRVQTFVLLQRIRVLLSQKL